VRNSIEERPLTVINSHRLVFGLDAVSEGIFFVKADAHLHWCGTVSSGIILSFDSSYLVDPASSHMLVSKIKPCMSKYKHLYTVKLRTAHYISYYLFDGTLLHG
jgi:hypothetical protein